MKINETIVTGKAPAVNRADMPAFDPRQAAAAAHMPTESAASVMFAAGSGPAKIKQEDAHQAPNKKLLRAPFFRHVCIAVNGMHHGTVAKVEPGDGVIGLAVAAFGVQQVVRSQRFHLLRIGCIPAQALT